jgi:hypothetical protein
VRAHLRCQRERGREYSTSARNAFDR